MSIKIKKSIKPVIIVTVLLLMFISYNVFFRNDEVEALSRYGSRGDEVIQIQTKLKRWGYYNGVVDRNIWKPNFSSS